MAFVKETHTTTTYTKTNPGYGIMCDNTNIYCDSEKYYCDGAIVMRSPQGIRCNSSILCNVENINLSGCPMFRKNTY